MHDPHNRSITADDIAAFLEGMEFPASKSEVVDYIEDREAPDEIIDYLDHLPEHDYYSLDEVLHHLKKTT